MYGRDRFTSYFKTGYFTRWCTNLSYLKVLASGRQVWPGFFQFWAALVSGWLVQDPAWCTCGIEADAILSPRWGGWAGVTIEVDYWWATPGGWAINNIVFELAMETAPLGGLLIRQNWDNSCILIMRI